MSKNFLYFLFGIFVFLYFATTAHAATFKFENAPASITNDQNFEVSVILSISSSAGKSYYLRAAFYHADSPSSYFGYTKNNAGEWYNGKPSIDKTKYYKITLDENNQWSGNLNIKPDLESSYYKGSGAYYLKLGRYTEDGGSVKWCVDESDGCNVTSISITSEPTPIPTSPSTPTPTRTPTPTKTPTPTPSPTLRPSLTPTTKPTLTKTPTPKFTYAYLKNEETEAPTLTLSLKTSQSPTSVLGQKIEKVLSPTPSKKSENPKLSSKTLETNNARTIIPQILMFMGAVFLLACGILTFRSFKRSKEAEE